MTTAAAETKIVPQINIEVCGKLTQTDDLVKQYSSRIL